MHEALLYATDEELVSAAVTFLRDGTRQGEATLLCFDERRRRLIVDALGDPRGVMRLDADPSLRPVEAQRRAFDLVRGLVARGDGGVRIIGDVPHEAWGGWVRYEAAINHFYAGLPVRLMCAHDTRSMDASLVDDVKSTHPRVVEAGGPAGPSPLYQDPAAFITDRARTDVDPLEATPPAVHLVDPTPGQARQAVGSLLDRAPLDDESANGLRLAVGEVTHNALIHGRPPVDVRAWVAPERIVVTVLDHGPGVDDPFAGLMAPPQLDGRCPNGTLALVAQTVEQVTFARGPDGFVVRLIGRPR